ncbi:MAG: extracellular solute-binding protein [Planctomycetota bacterium]
MRRFLFSSLFLALFVSVSSCSDVSTPTQEVVVYTALDRNFSEVIFEAFEKKTGIKVRASYDTESTKSVGLANRIRRESKTPRCDVFWNNEIVNTLLLKKEGHLQTSSPKEAANYPATFRDPEGYWYGFAARARVLIVNTELVPEARRPTKISDLIDPQWKGKVGIAKPLFGTTASHVAALFALHGPEKAKEFLTNVRANEAQIHGGNKGCARAVADGHNAFAMTDTDDAIIEKEAGKPVAIVYPDAGDGEDGTLLIPNTLAVLKGAPNPGNALKLIEYLLSPEVEKALANGPSAQIPLNKNSAPNTKLPKVSRPMKIDFEKAAEQFAPAREYVEKVFLK